ncbi:MAG: N-acetylmuramoyl-L-alanine amidase family protein [Chloroflexota bacterium]
MGFSQRIRELRRSLSEVVHFRPKGGAVMSVAAATAILFSAQLGTGSMLSNHAQAASTPTAYAAAIADAAGGSGATTNQAAQPAAQRTIVIDPGHGGSQTGATTKMADGSTLYEKDLTLKVALKTAQILRDEGYNVILTRTGDTGVDANGQDLTGNGKVDVSDDLQARVDFANNAHADVFVAIHFNAGNSNMSGTEVFYNANRPQSPASKLLATMIYDHVTSAIKGTGYNLVERGVKTDSQATGGAPFYLLGPEGGHIVRPSEMPAALGEALFISNPAEAQLANQDSFQNTLAHAYADGIVQYVNHLDS